MPRPSQKESTRREIWAWCLHRTGAKPWERRKRSFFWLRVQIALICASWRAKPNLIVLSSLHRLFCRASSASFSNGVSRFFRSHFACSAFVLATLSWIGVEALILRPQSGSMASPKLAQPIWLSDSWREGVERCAIFARTRPFLLPFSMIVLSTTSSLGVFFDVGLNVAYCWKEADTCSKISRNLQMQLASNLEEVRYDRVFPDWEVLDTSRRIFLTVDGSTNQYEELMNGPIANTNFLVIRRPKIKLVEANSSYDVGLKDEVDGFNSVRCRWRNLLVLRTFLLLVWESYSAVTILLLRTPLRLHPICWDLVLRTCSSSALSSHVVSARDVSRDRLLPFTLSIPPLVASSLVLLLGWPLYKYKAALFQRKSASPSQNRVQLPPVSPLTSPPVLLQPDKAEVTWKRFHSRLAENHTRDKKRVVYVEIRVNNWKVRVAGA